VRSRQAPVGQQSQLYMPQAVESRALPPRRSPSYMLAMAARGTSCNLLLPDMKLPNGREEGHRCPMPRIRSGIPYALPPRRHQWEAGRCDVDE